MKTKLFTLLFALVASAGTMFAEKVQIGDLYYNLRNTDKTAEVTYKSYSNYTTYNEGWNVTNANIPASVTYHSVTYSVTSIGWGAFYDCRSLTSVTIPNSVTSIGDFAFYNCRGLTSIEIPNSVTSIGNYAFYGCSGITEITIPNSVTSIGGSAFGECSGLMSIEIPNSVTNIGSGAFTGCSSLMSIEIPNSVTNIGSGAFTRCSGLMSIEIPNSVTNIEDETFSLCFGLTSVTIGNGVKSIGRSAFAECESITSVMIPNTVTTIGERAFSSCRGLTSVSIPNSVTSIGSSAFSGCGLISLTIPNSVTNIGAQAFFGTGLRSVVIGHNVTSIMGYAFYGCISLVSITIHSKVPPICGTNAMPEFNRHTIYVPCESVNDYKTAWSSQESRIQANPNYEYAFECQVSPSDVGVVEMPTSICADTIITAVPNYGYHFVQWSDSVTENPRAIELTQDTSFTAILAKNPIIRYNYDPEMGSINGDTTLASTATGNVTFSAVPNYGYHFSQWSDGVKDNPRTIYLTQDTMFSVDFARNTYAITTETSDIEWGSTIGDTAVLYLDSVLIAAIPNLGYNFVQWSDGSTANPYLVEITRDTTLTAIFGKNTYVIDKHADSIMGSIASVAQAEYLDSVTITAKPNYGYHFTQWSDGVADNPRTIVLTQDTTFTAEFAKNKYTITKETYAKGSISGKEQAEYLDTTVFTAIPNVGYHFVRWLDGVTDNPRSIILTQDTTLTALFAINQYTITWKNDNGSIVDKTIVEYGQTPSHIAPIKPATAQYTYTFAGWFPELVTATEDATYKASFDSVVNKYAITFKNGEQELQSTEVEYGQFPVYNGATPTKSADAQYKYIFAGWSPEVVAVTEAATYVATFNTTINSYTITWKNDDGSTIDQTTVEYGQLPAHADPSKVATAEFTYTFAGWSPNVVAVTGDAEYIATYTSTRNSYTITWKNDDGSIIDQTTVEYGQVPTHAEATKTATVQYAYTFAGWSPNIVAVTGDTTYTATYIATVRKYTIAFLDDDGSLISQQSVEYGQLPQQESPTKPSTAKYTYIFAGWTPEIVAVTGNATYTATYTTILRKYTITFLDDNGVLLSDKQWNYGEIPSCEEPTKADDEQYTYTFDGWTPEVVPVVGEATYTATYTAKDKHEGFENVSTEPAPQKVMIDGTIYILRGEKVYTLQGQEVR